MKIKEVERELIYFDLMNYDPSYKKHVVPNRAARQAVPNRNTQSNGTATIDKLARAYKTLGKLNKSLRDEYRKSTAK